MSQPAEQAAADVAARQAALQLANTSLTMPAFSSAVMISVTEYDLNKIRLS